MGNILTDDQKGDGVTPTPAEVTVDLDPITAGDQSSLIVAGEGTWTYNPTTGIAGFTPETTFKSDPTPIVYNMTETATGKSDTAILWVDYLPKTVNNSDVYIPGLPKTVDILANDSNGDTIVPSTVTIVGADPLSNGKTKTVLGEGVWTVNPITGTITFTPASGFVGNPTPIFYTGNDNDGNTSNQSQVSLIANAPSLVDVELTKTSNSQCQVNVDDIITFTVKVFRKDTLADLVAISVRDSLTSNMIYVSHTVSEGNFNAITGIWSGINIAAGDTATMTVSARVMTSVGGLACNMAWVHTQDRADVDSQPGNSIPTEDDIAKSCVSLPILLCSARGETIELSAPTGYASYIWQRNGSVIQGANSNVYVATESGSYTVEIPGLNICPVAGCCPIIITDYCECLNQICIPFIIRKTK
ncbi:DUF11 domain-containing protein [Lacihabitans soyangensis]|uniref:DUF11 domain-containing protein n=1 Tax=Lacihabitans soyangensis TaxID=869394 RepID=A0AAE3KV25_9BACT|nr:DUF11 domain-containing protein [Lacihabitans soyangensis]